MNNSYETWLQDHKPAPLGRVMEQLDEIPLGRWGAVGCNASNPKKNFGPGTSVKRHGIDEFQLGCVQERYTLAEAAKLIFDARAV